MRLYLKSRGEEVATHHGRQKSHQEFEISLNYQQPEMSESMLADPGVLRRCESAIKPCANADHNRDPSHDNLNFTAGISPSNGIAAGC